jgi:hypothetical protein
VTARPGARRMHVKVPQPIWAYLGRTHRSRSRPARPPPQPKERDLGLISSSAPICHLLCRVRRARLRHAALRVRHRRRDRPGVGRQVVAEAEKRGGREVKFNDGSSTGPARAGAAAPDRPCSHPDAVQAAWRRVGVGAAFFPGAVSLRCDASWLARKF